MCFCCAQGGSASGSASTVASGAADFSLAVDTAGDLRVPASHCGVYGFRPTHGSVPLNGAMSVAPSFDALGWVAKSPEILASVGKAVLGLDVAEAEKPK